MSATKSLAGFHEYLSLAGDDIAPSLRLLLTEYIKYTLDRAWFYYPAHLPKEALATEIRNGHIDRHLAIPLEDLYADGQPAGQVGQEVYGSGAAFALTTRAFHRLPDAPFLLYSEYPWRTSCRPRTAVPSSPCAATHASPAACA